MRLGRRSANLKDQDIQPDRRNSLFPSAVGVLELYSDVTPTMDRLRSSTFWLVMVVAAMFSSLLESCM